MHQPVPSGRLAAAVLAQARRTPRATAVEHGTRTLDYAGLDLLSARAATRLRALGVRPGQAVAVALPRSWQAVCVLLGARRAGATVVPLDRLSPPDRQRHILGDSAAVLVVREEAATPGETTADALLTPGPGPAPGEPADTGTDAPEGTPAFLFYTSGSTGRPKGVEVTDAGVLRLGAPGWIDLPPGARYACLANPAFDALSFEIWAPLLTGGTCVVLDDARVQDPRRFADTLRERRIDTLFVTAALFDAVVEKVPDCFAGAARVLIGGERLNAPLIRRWYAANPSSRTVLYNAYGPTEASTFALCHPIPRDLAGDDIPLGAPLPGTGTELRTEDGRTAGTGDVAELWLSGPALARGYRDLPAETGRAFRTAPDGTRWYRTGDLVRVDADGRVVYVGRADRQVKVRGFRIEPGEVEQRLLTHPAIRRAHVCTRRGQAGRDELIAFLVLGDDLSYDAYQRHLTAVLPPYMRPHRSHLRAGLPLTPNGKVDQSALLRDAGPPWRGGTTTVPVTAAQRPVLEIAEEILDVTGLRPDDRWTPNGGDSLTAMRFRFEVLTRLGADLPQDLVLRADFAALAEAANAPGAATRTRPPVPDGGDEPDAPATSEQERLWLLHRRDPDDRSYDVPLAFRVDGTVDTAALRRALATLVTRHPALRTRLVATPDGLRQRTEAPYDPWRLLDAAPGEPWQETAARFFAHRFDLTDPRMLRAAWVPDPDGGLLLLHLHHVAVDGWSLNVLFRDLSAAHRGDRDHPEPAATPLDLARWQGVWHATDAYARRRTALLGHYDGTPRPAPALPAPETPGRPGAALLRTTLDPARRTALDRRAAQLGLTRFQLLVSAFATALHGVTGQDRPLIAAPVANRPRPEFADTVGMFANTVLLGLPVTPDDTLTAHLTAHADTVRTVLAGDEVALADVLTAPALRDRAPLFDYLFVLENTRFSDLRLDGCAVRPLWPAPLGAKAALTLSVIEHDTGFDCLWEHRDDIGADRTEAAARLFRDAVDHLTGDTGARTTVRDLIAPYRHSLPDTGRGGAAPADFTTVAEGFARQVARTPDAPAVSTGDLVLTYSALDAHADRLAGELRALVPSDPAAPAAVALYLQPSAEHIVALLAAARLNVTVVPLDPAYPPALLRHVLDQADPLCVLTTPEDLALLGTLAPPSLPRHPLTLTGTPAAPPRPAPRPHAALRPLYTLFTSGSTGTPKGVQVPDATLCNLLTWQRTEGGLGRAAVTQQFSMLSFDVSFQEIFTTLCSGGLLRLIDPAWRQDVPALLDHLESGGAERIFLPYVALQLLAEHGVRTGRYPSRLRDVVTAGEQLVCTDAVRRWFTGLSGARLFNHYGPTETHVVSGLCLDGDPARWPARPAIGRPVTHAVLRVVDEAGLPVPPGVTGELLIGGPMARRCYLGAAHDERFLDDPALGTLYRTGDRARFGTDGLLHYAGRDDGQVKLGGHRLELGQVEAALTQYPGVTGAVAVVEDGRLAVALRCRDADPDPADLAAHLARLLPAHVRVARFRRLTDLPRTPSGKADRRAALTAPGHDLRPTAARDTARTPLERRLLTLFESVTGRAVTADQRFFDAGATSLDLMRFHLRCAGEGDLPFDVPDLFEHVTVRALARFLDGRGRPDRQPFPAQGRPACADQPASSPDRQSSRTDQPASSADRQSSPAEQHPSPADRQSSRTGRSADEPVAVIGMAVRLPGAADLAAFWELTLAGRRGIEHFPAPDGRVGARSRLDGLLAFDPGRFTISPQEARLMDPQQRHLLMTCVEALAHAGVADPAVRRVGLVASCGENTYFQHMLRDGDPDALPDAFRLALHHEKDFLATKAAYHLGLTGPALTVQSACSSSLVGTHVAAGLLRQGDADVMLVGGVLVDPGLSDGYTYRPHHIFSPDGHCRPFDADAAGTVGASGAAVVVLKPLSAARRDGDTVYAVVTGSGINNDGSDKLGYSAPSLSGQRDAIRTALARSGRDATDLGYVEAHGTGTRLGDPVEAAALRQAYGLADDARVPLSSVKSQIGHLGAAAGVTGLVRAVLAVHHGVVPPTADFTRLNPEIADGPFRVPVTAEPWPEDRPRVAAVSSFGIGGTNAHLLLEQPLPASGPTPAGAPPCLVLSGASEAAVREDARRVAAYLRSHPDAYPRVLRHLQAGRPALPHRAAAVCPDATAAVAWLGSAFPVTHPDPRPRLSAEDPHTLARAWTDGHLIDHPRGPAPAPWDFPPPAFDTAEYDFPRARQADRPAHDDRTPRPDPGPHADRAPHAHPAPRTPQTPPRPARRPERLPADQWLHQPVWARLRRARTHVPHPGTPHPTRTAVIVTTADPADPAATTPPWHFLTRHYARVVTVHAGDTLTRLDDDRYVADPADLAQLTALLARIAPGPRAGTDWLHALPLTLGPGFDEADLETAQWACLDTVAALVRALADLPAAHRPRLWLLSHGAQPATGTVATPAAGLLASALQVPRQELGVTAHWADLPGPTPAEWADHLPDLLLDGTHTAVATALRDGYWWHPVTQPVTTPPTAPPAPHRSGTHLLLGGTGGIGATLAARLLARPGNRVVLVARGTALPPVLRAHRDRVTLIRADLATDDLTALAERLAPHLDGLTGIVHAAGTAGGRLLARRDTPAARRTTAAKLRGAVLTERLIAAHEPDYALYCSSMAARHGGVGQFDYAAANACLDACAHHTPPHGRTTTVRLSIGWDAWREVGMAAHPGAADARHRDHLAVALTPEDGAALFDRALDLRLPHLLVSTTALDQARHFYEPAPGPAPAPVPATATDGDGDRAAALTDVLLGLLGTETLDPGDALYDLGADSLTLIELLDEIKRRYGTDIELSRLSHRVSLTEILRHLGAGAEASTAVEVETWQHGTGPDVLCLVHPVGGDIQAYRPLVAALPATLTVCLIADPRLRDPGLPARSIPDRAAHYLEAVRAAFPGPGRRLRLAGWSFGAWTALSMAALAEADGHPAASLHLIDPPPPDAGARLAAYDDERLDAVFAHELTSNGAGPLTASGRAYAERLADCCRANLAAMAGHRPPRPERTPATVWLAERPAGAGLLAPAPAAPDAWTTHLPGPVTVHRLDTSHYGIVTAPHVQAVAAALAAPEAGLRHPERP
ncbi:SDR family NAD(P)-dependent oxidoreductase [Streptomyces daghestanicus]|uniref:Non-ribosomal peptide synthetase n=1 Tax=Streptomyces daghestanicus TaxID=66885 RepID=A0ABQ3PYA6_9ACTN|nr:SDR family NAD(P)-dependent oxidoreductase [Streptomyces daghestanicus]GGU63874.1 non-ribosomal peptide synthetase [Streptomyces daghestanicus]GHI30008.1 non-ribosomal peptide synthetase [Streptomyces daghestanicus]